MNIIFNISPTYEKQAATVLARILEIGDDIENVLIITNVASEWALLRRWGETTNVKINVHIVHELNDLELQDRYTPIIYGRLFLDQNFCFNRGLYLDVDIWPRKSLRELWTRFTDDIVYAVTDLDSERQKSRLAKEGFDGLSQYVNAGVILFNDIDALKNDFKDMQKLIPQDFKYHDQDILNIVLNKKINFLPPKYNHMSFKYSDEAVLVHFAHAKPWNVPCWHQNARDYMNAYEDLFGATSRQRLSHLRILKLLLHRFVI